VKVEAREVGITAGSREVTGRNACDRRHTYCIIITMMMMMMMIIIIITTTTKFHSCFINLCGLQ